MAGLVNATLNENLLWTIERTVSNVFIPLLNTNCMGDKGSDQLLYKVKKELLPCLRSFTRSGIMIFSWFCKIIICPETANNDFLEE